MWNDDVSLSKRRGNSMRSVRVQRGRLHDEEENRQKRKKSRRRRGRRKAE
jgi:hypothetical protein